MANINKRLKHNIEIEKQRRADENFIKEKEEKKEKRKNKTKYLVAGAIIAAIYFVLTFFLSSFSYGMIQFRISEALMALVFFEPAAGPGLILGCFLANLAGPGGFYDAVMGTCATGFGIYIIKWYKSHGGKVWVSLALYAFVNAFMIALMLSYTGLYGEGRGMLVIFLWVLLGEAVCAVGGGMVIYKALSKRWKDIIGETAQSEESRSDS